MKPYILILITILSSCSMNHHLTKAVNKGYKVETVTKEVRFTDTLIINGKDSIIERLVKVDCPEPVIQTKWRVRFDNKRFKDSTDVISNMYSDSLDNALKTTKYNTRANKSNNKLAEKLAKYKKQIVNVSKRQENKSRFWIGILVGSLGIILILFIIYLIIKKI